MSINCWSSLSLRVKNKRGQGPGPRGGTLGRPLKHVGKYQVLPANLKRGCILDLPWNPNRTKVELESLCLNVDLFLAVLAPCFVVMAFSSSLLLRGYRVGGLGRVCSAYLRTYVCMSYRTSCGAVRHGHGNQRQSFPSSLPACLQTGKRGRGWGYIRDAISWLCVTVSSMNTFLSFSVSFFFSSSANPLILEIPISPRMFIGQWQ